MEVATVLAIARSPTEIWDPEAAAHFPAGQAGVPREPAAHEALPALVDLAEAGLEEAVEDGGKKKVTGDRLQQRHQRQKLDANKTKEEL